MTGALLDVHDLHAGYGTARILHGVTLAVEAGSITALVGGNGAGKSTLMRAIAGTIPTTEGRIVFKGKLISDAPAHRRVAEGLILVPEGRLVFPTMTVTENLRLGAITPRARWDSAARLDTILARFPRLRERATQAAATLSGGEQQMLALGRGLMAQPDLVLLDEPTLGLAPVMVKQLFDTILALRQGGFTVLLAEQDVRRTLEVADQAYVIENGRVALSGSGAELSGNPAVQRAYMGL